MSDAEAPRPSHLAAAEYGEWQTINATLERIACPGGWLYRNRLMPLAMTFVPEPRPSPDPDALVGPFSE